MRRNYFRPYPIKGAWCTRKEDNKIEKIMMKKLAADIVAIGSVFSPIWSWKRIIKNSKSRAARDYSWV
jgi:hypothetical protein